MRDFGIETWRANVVVGATQKELVRRMGQAVVAVRDQVKVLSNVGNPTGLSPSAPGEPPRKVSGTFFRSVTGGPKTVSIEGIAVVGRVGTNVPYQPRLELGFHGTDSLGRRYAQAPRPAFRPALAMQLSNVRRLLAVGREPRR